ARSDQQVGLRGCEDRPGAGSGPGSGAWPSIAAPPCDHPATPATTLCCGGPRTPTARRNPASYVARFQARARHGETNDCGRSAMTASRRNTGVRASVRSGTGTERRRVSEERLRVIVDTALDAV